jgi:hypothetical protein
VQTYSFVECLNNSYKVNWRIRDVLGDRSFDRSKRWLPEQLSGAGDITCLSGDERKKLTHVEMGAYAHLFGYVEAFIAPQISTLAQEVVVDDRESYDALTNFAAEEVKHMTLFRKVRAMVDETLGIRLRLLEDPEKTAAYVLSKNRGAVLLLTALIEWFTQGHYLLAIKEDDSLTPLTKRVFQHHWMEEAQHAKMDNMETLRAFSGMTEAERDQAIDDLIELVGAVDGLLQKQADYDVENLQDYLGRAFPAEDKQEIYENVLKAKRYVFIESGVTHPRFQELFTEVTTPEQRECVGAVLREILQTGNAKRSGLRKGKKQ